MRCSLLRGPLPVAASAASVLDQGWGSRKTVSATGYPSTIEKDAMRTQRITVDENKVEMR